MEKKLFVAFIVTYPEYLRSPAHKKEVLSTLKGCAVENTINHLFLDFFKKECEPFIDSLVGISYEARKNILHSFSEKSLVHKVFCDIIGPLTSRETESFVKKIYICFSPKSAIVIIRTPREICTESRKNMRQHYQNDCVLFETQEDLIGGMMTYRNGDIVDQSFSSYLSRIYSLNS